MGFTSAALTPDTPVDRAVGRRAPGPGDRPGAPLRGRHHHPRRADDGPLAEGDREAPALRGRHPGRRQVGDLHRPQHLPRLLGVRTGSSSSTAAASRASSRPRATRSKSSWASCARSRRRAPTRSRSATGRSTATLPAARPERRRERAATAPTRRATADSVTGVRHRLGVADRHHRRVPAALARLHHPGARDVPVDRDLPVVRPDDARTSRSSPCP